jgi:hypothetical protein
MTNILSLQSCIIEACVNIQSESKRVQQMDIVIAKEERKRKRKEKKKKKLAKLKTQKGGLGKNERPGGLKTRKGSLGKN